MRPVLPWRRGRCRRAAMPALSAGKGAVLRDQSRSGKGSARRDGILRGVPAAAAGPDAAAQAGRPVPVPAGMGYRGQIPAFITAFSNLASFILLTIPVNVFSPLALAVAYLSANPLSLLNEVIDFNSLSFKSDKAF